MGTEAVAEICPVDTLTTERMARKRWSYGDSDYARNATQSPGRRQRSNLSPPRPHSKFPGLSPIGHIYLENNWDFPGGLVVKNPPANAGDLVSIPGLGGFHGPRGN